VKPRENCLLPSSNHVTEIAARIGIIPRQALGPRGAIIGRWLSIVRSRGSNDLTRHLRRGIGLGAVPYWADRFEST
jgi:hypothetical protein